MNRAKQKVTTKEPGAGIQEPVPPRREKKGPAKGFQDLEVSPVTAGLEACTSSILDSGSLLLAPEQLFCLFLCTGQPLRHQDTKI